MNGSRELVLWAGRVGLGRKLAITLGIFAALSGVATIAVLRGLWPGANLLCQSAIGGRMAPSNLASRSIDLVEERALVIEVELEL